MLLASACRALLAAARPPRASRLCRRCIAHYAVDPAVRDVASTLAQTHPAFEVSARKVLVLHEPPQFYSLLLDLIRRAERHIFISSLYIGSAESELVRLSHTSSYTPYSPPQIDTLRTALSEKPELQLYMQLDLNRSTRPGTSSTAKILLPLVEAFPDRVHVSFFRSPSLRGILAKLVPPRFNEGWGTWHAKIYGADDEVIISGANLNQSYFTNRQDRYIHFATQPHMAQYCFDFLRTVSTFSYRLAPASTHTRAPHSYHHEGYALHWPDAHTHPHAIHQKAETALASFQAQKRTLHALQPSQLTPPSPPPSEPGDTADNVLLFPVIQAGQFNIREEESALALLFRHLARTCTSGARPLVDLTTGYFGLYAPYRALVLAHDVDTRIVAASPRANGFFGSNGISGRIPEGYTLLEQRFMRAVSKARRVWDPVSGRGVLLSEWEREGWTYHAKGIWVSPTPCAPPVLTLFGSTNLNSRSAHIDTELSFIMVVPSPPTPAPVSGTVDIRRQLADEVSRIRAYAVEWKGAGRRVRFWTKLIVGLVKGML
ncbi:hypothetical protein H0H81_004479 [Sphagnurus paluster]|uniref:CDP-diacylglycerol--glycerol-3-phosphate 3-phosphatidyltransferase n=1 Tax=Sphagnurus paluster TaxID=117069 RepID=A0A9P7FYL7_9AGAR|nr:hypothetical protein H0H81_004479 [Sphagnurus paluster]